MCHAVLCRFASESHDSTEAAPKGCVEGISASLATEGGEGELRIVGCLDASTRAAIRVAVTWAIAHVPVLSRWLRPASTGGAAQGSDSVRLLWRVGGVGEEGHEGLSTAVVVGW